MSQRLPERLFRLGLLSVDTLACPPTAVPFEVVSTASHDKVSRSLINERHG
jgi:uncharacterized protein YbaR (Trm112 family)